MSIAEKLTTIAENEQKVYEAGQKSEYDKFWDTYQQNGNKTSYAYAFAFWDASLVKPKYDLIPTVSAQGIFYECDIAGDIEEFFANQGITLDLSKINSSYGVNQIFRGCRNLTRIGVLNCSNCTQFIEVFYADVKLETIEKLILSEKITTYGTTAFTSCSRLKNLTVEGTIVRSFNISPCSSLTVDSALTIIRALKDNSGTTDAGKYTVTFHNNVITQLSSALCDGVPALDVIKNKGWSY